VLAPEQALNSNAPAIRATLKRFEIIFQFPVGWKRGDLRSLSYAAKPLGIMKLCWATALVQVVIA